MRARSSEGAPSGEALIDVKDARRPVLMNREGNWTETTRLALLGIIVSVIDSIAATSCDLVSRYKSAGWLRRIGPAVLYLGPSEGFDN